MSARAGLNSWARYCIPRRISPPMSKNKNPPGLRERDGHWHYRFNLHGVEYTASTGLKATPRNVNAAQQAKHNERARLLGGGTKARTTKGFSDAVTQFLEWHKG